MLPAFFLFLLLCLSGFSLSTASAEGFSTRHTENFILRYTPQDRKIADVLSLEIEEIRSRIIADIGKNVAGKTLVFIAPTVESFQKLQPAGAPVPLWAAGVAYPQPNLIILRSPRAVRGGRSDVKQLFTHEFSHIALSRALPDQKIPLWLNEGLAMYQSREWNFSRTSVLIKGILTGTLIPLDQLTASFPFEDDRAQLAYAQSFMFISFLINQMGREAFHRLILDFSTHGDVTGSLRRATGLSLNELENQWLLFLKLRISWLPILTSASTIWFIATALFISGYVRKKRQGQAILKRWAMEEEAAEEISKPS